MTKEVLLNLTDVVLTMPVGMIWVLMLVDEWRFTKKKTASVMVLYLAVMLPADYAVFSYLQDVKQAEIWIALLQMASGLLLYAYLAKDQNGSVFFVYFSIMSLLFAGDAAGDMLASGRDIWHFFVQIMTYLAIAVILYRFCKKPFLEVYYGLKKGWMLLSLIPGSICFAFAYFMRVKGPLYQHPEFWPVASMLCMITGCVYAALYIVFYNLKEQYEMHVDAIHALDEQITQLRHDIRHFMHMQSVLLENPDIKEVKHNLAILGENFEEVWSGIQIKSYTGNDTIDTVLSFYEKRAGQEQVSMQIKMELPKMTKEYMEFVVILSNLIECALRGCKNTSGHTAKTISLTGRRHEKEYYLEVIFEYRPPVYGWGECTPEQFDIETARRNMETFVKKYQGVCNYRTDGGRACIWMIF